MSSPSHFLRNGTVNIVHQVPKSFRITPTFPGKSLDGRHDRFPVPVNVHDDFPFRVGESLQNGVTSIPGLSIPRRTIGILAIISQHMAAHGSVIAFRHQYTFPVFFTRTWIQLMTSNPHRPAKSRTHSTKVDTRVASSEGLVAWNAVKSFSPDLF